MWRKEVAKSTNVSDKRLLMGKQHGITLGSSILSSHLANISTNLRRLKSQEFTMPDPLQKKFNTIELDTRISSGESTREHWATQEQATQNRKHPEQLAPPPPPLVETFLNPTNSSPKKRKRLDAADDLAGKRLKTPDLPSTGGHSATRCEAQQDWKHQEQLAQLAPSLPESTPYIPISNPSQSSTKEKKPGSPRKAKTLDQDRSQAHIDLPFLETCKPSVTMRMYSEIKEEGAEIPQAVQDLYEKLSDIPGGPIPSEVKVNCPRFAYCDEGC